MNLAVSEGVKKQRLQEDEDSTTQALLEPELGLNELTKPILIWAIKEWSDRCNVKHPPYLIKCSKDKLVNRLQTSCKDGVFLLEVRRVGTSAIAAGKQHAKDKSLKTRTENDHARQEAEARRHAYLAKFKQDSIDNEGLFPIGTQVAYMTEDRWYFGTVAGTPKNGEVNVRLVDCKVTIVPETCWRDWGSGPPEAYIVRNSHRRPIWTTGLAQPSVVVVNTHPNNLYKEGTVYKDGHALSRYDL